MTNSSDFKSSIYKITKEFSDLVYDGDLVDYEYKSEFDFNDFVSNTFIAGITDETIPMGNTDLTIKQQLCKGTGGILNYQYMIKKNGKPRIRYESPDLYTEDCEHKHIHDPITGKATEREPSKRPSFNTLFNEAEQIELEKKIEFSTNLETTKTESETV